MTASLFQPLCELLQSADAWQAQPLPAQFATREGKHGAQLRSFWLLHPKGTQVRALHILSAKAEVILIMGYPRAAEQVPVLAVEYVAFNGQPYVAVADLQSVSLNQELHHNLNTQLARLHQHYQALLSSGGEVPDWANYFSPVCLYSRPQRSDELPLLIEAFATYWHIWLARFVSLETGEYSGQRALQRYQQHHIQHSPGKPFMKTLFGQTWSTAYMQQFIYNSQGLLQGV